jgi:hypothetical protein
MKINTAIKLAEIVSPTPKKKTEDKPERGKVYVLFGGKGEPCIAKGNTWAESEVE